MKRKSINLHTHGASVSWYQSRYCLDGHSDFLFQSLCLYGFMQLRRCLDNLDSLLAMGFLLFSTCGHPGRNVIIKRTMLDMVPVYLCLKNTRSLRALISPILFMALSVVCNSSLSYRTGTFLRFSKSM